MAAALDSVFAVGSRLKPFQFRLEHEDRTAINLTGQTVTLTMYPDAGGPPKINAGACVITNPTPAPPSATWPKGEPHGYYPWVAGDVDTAGDFWIYIKRTSGALSADLPEGPDGQNRGRSCKIKFVTAA